MAIKSTIQWTQATWNVARGCSKVDADCKFCYMYRDSFDGTRYNPREVKRTKTVFDLPLKLKESSLIFTSSLTDFFHPEIDSFRDEAWDIIEKRKDHIYQILTKRPERILNNLPPYWDEIKHCVWLGTSVGHQDGEYRIRELVEVGKTLGTTNLFLSLEPLHGPVDLFEVKDWWHYISWVIVGGESGNNTGSYRFRPCHFEWIFNLVTECKEANVPIFVKQLGTWLAKLNRCSDRHGGLIEEFPMGIQVRDYPKEFSHLLKINCPHEI